MMETSYGRVLPIKGGEAKEEKVRKEEDIHAFVFTELKKYAFRQRGDGPTAEVTLVKCCPLEVTPNSGQTFQQIQPMTDQETSKQQTVSHVAVLLAD